jgi:hypothetical protein
MLNWFKNEPKQKAPAHAIPIIMPKGGTYLKLWRDDARKRVCMEFAAKPGYWMVWDVRTIPQMIEILEKLLAENPLPPLETTTGDE